MNKIIILSAISALVLTACSEQQTMEPIIEKTMKRVADGYISPSKAIEIANEFAAKMESTPQEGYDSHSSIVNRHATSTKNIRNICIANSRSESNLIYVVNYDNEAGFALISKKDIATPVLAFIEDGSYNDATASKIEGFCDFIDYANGHLSTPYGLSWRDSIPVPPLPTDTVTTPFDSIPPRLDISDPYSEHFIHTNWGQLGVFGALCPNKIAGCGPTAIAMVLAHYEYPETLTVTYDRSNRKIALDWTTIKEHLKEERFPNKPNSPIGGSTLPIYENPDHDLWSQCKYTPCTKESHEQISILFRQIGYDTYASYGSDGTSVSSFSIYKAIGIDYKLNNTPFIDYSSDKDFYIKSAAKHKQPVIFLGKNTETDEGHVWICDGHKKITPDDIESDYYHMNWGYDGEFNGFFLAGVFHLKPSYYEYNDIKYSVVSKK